MIRHLYFIRANLRRLLQWSPFDDLEPWKIISGAVIVGIICVVILYSIAPELRIDFGKGLFVEFGGFLFDLVFLGVFIGWFESKRNIYQEVRRYREEIDDFKKWDSHEARCRIAGNIRRLAKYNATDIDFAGVILTGFSFLENDIKSIRGSKFYDGSWGTWSGREKTRLTKVGFSTIDCRDVIFSVFNPFVEVNSENTFICFEDCIFTLSDLRGAKFDGAHLKWTEPSGQDMYECDQDKQGEWFQEQIYFPPFQRANLQGASFQGCSFENADFREADNVADADFSCTTGLKTCAFNEADAEVLRTKGWLK